MSPTSYTTANTETKQTTEKCLVFGTQLVSGNTH